MENNVKHIKVREAVYQDITTIGDYWFNSSAEHLVGMGVDLDKMPKRSDFSQMLSHQLNLPYPQKKAYALIWEINGEAVGHSNVNDISYGQEAKMHLHLWTEGFRKKGMGEKLVRLSLPFYFEKLKLQQLICEPYAANPAPNRVMEKVGFQFQKKYLTIPGSINFEQEVNQWTLTLEDYRSTLSVDQ